jgi:Na+/melibiose symporter-like transporter
MNTVEKGYSLPRVLVFSLAALPTSALSVALLVYLPPYFASHLGVSLGVIAASWATVRLVDFFIDPLLGMAMDRTRTRYGRYRAWLVAGAPVFMGSVYMLFMAPKGMSAFYLTSWLFVLYFGNSILSLAHSAWTGTLVTQYHQRSRVFGVLAAMGVISAVGVLLVPIVVGALGGSNAEGVRAMGWFVILITPFAIALPAFFTPETITTDLHSSHAAWRDYVELARRPELIRLVLAQMATTLGPGWMSSLYLYYFVASRGFSSSSATILLIAYILAGVVGAPATARLANYLGKHRTLITTTTAFALGVCVLPFLPRGNLPAVLPVLLWCGAMAAGFDLMIRAMLADVGDEIRLEQGKERISLLYALIALAAKIAAAFAISITYALLDRIGFNQAEGAVNTAGALFRLDLLFLLGPIGFVLLGGACVIGWKLDADRHASVRAQLDARDATLPQLR